MPVLTLEKPGSLASASPVLHNILRAVRQPLRMPAWALAAGVLLVGIGAFTAGRHKPAHHYVSYFGYPMVLDTTTGKSCYAAPPKTGDSQQQDASFAIDGAADPQASGQSIPMCGNE
ncbi:MAG TPA: hypothetical protein VGJ21_16120 [Terracidiphilus sp.]|jgi:hypothetical protein